MTSGLASSMFRMLDESANSVPVIKVPESDSFWMPNQASTLASDVDSLINFLIWLSTISTAVVAIAMFYFVAKYRSKGRAANERALSQVDHSNVAEILGSVLPMFLLLAVFALGFQGFIALRTSPKAATEIHAQAQKWKWLFTYPDGSVSGELHVRKGENVRVLINSTDVLHSLFIPEFRVKMDAVPGRYTELWFNATQEGTFPIYCTEYCGTSHSDMLASVTVHDEAGYDAWVTEKKKELESLPLPELGEKTYNTYGCAACHSLDGSPKVGPSFKGVFGKNEALTDGTSVAVDENYIRESIMEPQAKIVQGFPPSMPTFKGKISDREISGLVEFIKAQK